LNIPTVSFAAAQYASDYIEFVARETPDRNFEALQEPDKKDHEILDTFSPGLIIPFLLIDGQVMQVGSGYSPQLLAGMDHVKIKADIENLLRCQATR
jgi:hypothetical protein